MERVLITYSISTPKFFGGYDTIEQTEIIECNKEDVKRSVIADYEKWQMRFRLSGIKAFLSLKEYRVM